MTVSCQRLPKSTAVLTLTIPREEVKKTYDRVIRKAIEEVEVKGFRKGKAPKKLAEKQLDRAKVTQVVLNQILPSAYTQALKEHDLKPITAPKIEAEEAEEDKDWVFKITVAEKPKIKLEQYKEEIKKTKKVTPKVWTPGEKDEGKDKEKEPKEPPLRKVFEVLLKTVKIEIPDLLIENETNRLLAQTLDEVKRLGLALETYLSSVGKTPEGLRQETQKQAEETLRLEFILAEIAEQENVSVEPKEIDAFVQKTKDEKAKKALESQRYYLASLLRKQKTLNFLSSL